MEKENIDYQTVEGFGFEWSRFDQKNVKEEESKEIFAQYFKTFPWEKLPEDASGFDAGCGSGRWARFVAHRIGGTLHCIDASATSIRVAEKNLQALSNCIFYTASIDQLPLRDGSMDFGYALGVLHHVPYPLQALRKCIAKLKPGAPFLIYMYYAFDNRPFWFRALWRATDLMRRVLSRCPFRLRYVVSQFIAGVVYYPIAQVLQILENAGVHVEGFPLTEYRHRSFAIMRNDAYDRFATRLEKRFKAHEIKNIMERAGLEHVVFSNSPPFWCAVGYKKNYEF